MSGPREQTRGDQRQIVNAMRQKADLASEAWGSSRQSRANLRTARLHYDKWVTEALATDLIWVLRKLAADDEAELPVSSMHLCQSLYQELYQRVGQRADANYIRIYAESGQEPPDFVWMNDPVECNSSPAHRVRMSARERRRRGVPTRLVQGFRHHLAADRAVRERARVMACEQNESYLKKRSAELVFAETPGARQLFSIREAHELYQQAEQRFGRENKEYVENVFRKLLKGGNRRALAKAPTQEAIDDLRRNFPNAWEAIDHVDRAAALSRLTQDGFFQMPPLLLWGDPGVGKTACLQALARCMDTPFRRFDIGALSMGGQLFGLSLGWSTGRTGDIFNMLIESQCMNPIGFLDELEKAGGNPNAPVVPGLLSVLETETSQSYRDEAIDLPLNAGNIIWFAAANEQNRMSAALRSRFAEVRIHRPEGEDAVRVACSIYRSRCQASPWGCLFPKELERALALKLTDMTPRQMSLALSLAFGEAARCNRTYLKSEDFPAPPKPRFRMGFL